MENTLSEYKVLLYPKAYRDLEDIYSYISNEILEPSIAKKQIDRIWNGLESLTTFPYAHQDRLVGRFANKAYKQLLIDNYLAIYRIDEDKKEVFIITIQYVKRDV